MYLVPLLSLLVACGDKAPADTAGDPDTSPTTIIDDSGPADTSPTTEDSTAPTADADGDGYTDAVDCDDGDPAIHPTADEIWYDGIDQDCDGSDDDQLRWSRPRRPHQRGPRR